MSNVSFAAQVNDAVIAFDAGSDVLVLDMPLRSAPELRIEQRSGGSQVAVSLGGKTVVLGTSLAELGAANFALPAGFGMKIDHSGAAALTGTAGADILIPLQGNDSVNAGAGNDAVWLHSPAGGRYAVDTATDETLQGGAGFDWLMLPEDATLAATVDFALGRVTGGAYTAGAYARVGGFEAVMGTGLGDALRGRATAHEVFEIFEGRGGADTVSGAGGLDYASYFVAPAAVSVNLALRSAQDGYGTSDTFSGVEGAIGSSFGDTLKGNGGENSFIGMAGDDLIQGGGGEDWLQFRFERAGVNASLATGIVLDSFGGRDTVSGIEHIDGSGFADTLAGNGAANELYGAGGKDRLSGGNGNDSLFGAAGADTLIGGPGDDMFDGFSGDTLFDDALGEDELRGGDGNDFYTVDTPFDLVVETATGGFDTVRAASEYTLGGWVESLWLAPGVVRGTGNDIGNSIVGNERNNQLYGENGNDTIYGGNGHSEPTDGDTIHGGGGNDQLSGGFTGGDQLYGEDGNDTLNGGDWADLLVGGPGGDLFIIDGGWDLLPLADANGWDSVVGGTGEDTVQISAGYYYLLGGTEHLRLAGTATGGEGNGLANTMSGNGLANTLLGAAGNDTILGDGQDTQSLTTGSDDLSGGGGNDIIWGDFSVGPDYIGSPDLIGGGPGSDTLYGRAGDDDLFGDDDDDLLEGGEGEDTLDGGTGDDSLYAGGGSVTGMYDQFEFLYGGAGLDFIVGALGDDEIDGGDGADTAAGGGGDDLYRDVESVQEQFGEGNDSIMLSATSETYVVPDNVEHVEVVAYAVGVTGARVSGNAGFEVLIGEDGNDTIAGGAGPGQDTMTGGKGNDVIGLSSQAPMPFIDGGGNGATAATAGWDLVRFDGAGNAADVRTVFTDSIDNIDVIDVSGSGSNGLLIDQEFVYKCSDRSDGPVDLILRGGPDDYVGGDPGNPFTMVKNGANPAIFNYTDPSGVTGSYYKFTGTWNSQSVSVYVDTDLGLAAGLMDDG